MPSFPIPAAAAALLALAPGATPAPPPVVRAQLVIQQVVVRIPRLPANVSMPAFRATAWREKKGPKCVALAQLEGATIVQDDAVDLLSLDGGRVRAHLDDDCPALDFYSGFYLKATKDGKLCADRDSVRSRAGRACRIDYFRKLVAKR